MAIPFKMITLDKPRKLRFGMATSVEFEQVTGMKVTEIDDKNFSLELCGKLLWVMLKNEDKDLTFEGTLELIDEYSDNLVDVITAVKEAIAAAFTVGKTDPNA